MTTENSDSGIWKIRHQSTTEITNKYYESSKLFEVRY